MHHVICIYLMFWASNPYVALFIHAMFALFAVASIQTVREDNRSHLYHTRVYRDMMHARTEPEDENAD